MKKVAETIILLGAAMGFTGYAPAQEAPAAAESAQETPPAPAEETPAPAEVTPEPAETSPEPAVETPAPAEESPAPAATEPAVADEQPATVPTTGPATAPSTQPTTAPLDEEAMYRAQILASGQAILAERLVESAQAKLREERLDPAAFQHAASLIRAALKLNKNDPRPWRLLIELELQMGSREGAMSALKGYRGIVPQDEVAQVQLIELYAGQIEAADKELAYLRGLVKRETLSPPVRSHIAVMATQVHLDRGEQAAANELLDEALKLNPVNVAALDLKYQLLPPDATLAQRATALLAVLKANPVRPGALGQMGQLLATAGLGKEAVDWMNRGLMLYGRTEGVDPNAYHDLLIDYAAEQYILGQYQLLRGTLEQIGKVSPNDIDVATIQLLLERGGADPAPYDKARETASTALAASWADVARFVADQPAPEQNEGAAAAVGAPEPAEVAKQVQAAQDDAKQAAFVSAAADYAWFEIYFNGQPGNAGKWINALETVLPEDNVTLKRLRGWLALASNQPDEARKTLESIREADPLAALGLLHLELAAAGNDPDAQKPVDDAARQLLTKHSYGIVGAILTQALRERQLKPPPHADAEAIRAELKKFPLNYRDIATDPQRFYTIRVEPLAGRIAHRYGEPIYVRVILQNISNFDIPVGDDGVIRPTLWFDAEVQAMQSQRLLGTAMDRMTIFSLPARGAVAQFVRIDQGDLLKMLNGSPTPRLQVTGWCMTNPSRQGNGFGVGPAGYRVPFAKKMTRVGFQAGKEGVLPKLFEEVQQGLPDMKMRGISMLAAYVAQLTAEFPPLPANATPEQVAARQQQEEIRKQNEAQRNASAEPMLDILRAATADEVSSVAQWAKFELSRVGPKGEGVALVDSLLVDQAWEGRLLGVLAVENLGRKAALERLDKVAKSETEDELVKASAGQLFEMFSRVPTTQPGAADAAPAEEAAPAPPQ